MSTRAGSHHSMPESVTAITVEGRPVVVCQAVSTLFPSTPQSSWGLSESVGVARAGAGQLHVAAALAPVGRPLGDGRGRRVGVGDPLVLGGGGRGRRPGELPGLGGGPRAGVGVVGHRRARCRTGVHRPGGGGEGGLGQRRSEGGGRRRGATRRRWGGGSAPTHGRGQSGGNHQGQGPEAGRHPDAPPTDRTPLPVRSGPVARVHRSPQGWPVSPWPRR